MTTLSPLHVYCVLEFLSISDIKKISFINKRLSHILVHSPYLFSSSFQNLTPKAIYVSGDLTDNFQLNFSHIRFMDVHIGSENISVSYPIVNDEKTNDVDTEYSDSASDSENYKDVSIVPAIDPDFDEMMRDSFEPQKHKVRSLRVFLPTKCLVSLKPFSNLEKLTLCYDLLPTVFKKPLSSPEFAEDPETKFWKSVPNDFCRVVGAPLPLPQIVLDFLKALGPFCKKVVTPNVANYTQKTFGYMESMKDITFYLKQHIHPTTIPHLADNVILSSEVVDFVSHRLAGKKMSYTVFTQKYFPHFVKCSHVVEIHSAQNVFSRGQLVTIKTPSTVNSLVYKEEPPTLQKSFDFSLFTQLVSLDLSATQFVVRKVALPTSLKELSVDCFTKRMSDLGEIPNSVTMLTLRQFIDTEIVLPPAVEVLDLRWFGHCVAIANLEFLTKLVKMDIRGFKVRHLSFPSSLQSLTISCCHKLESVDDYNTIFDLHPTIEDCPLIAFN
ncbi:hypothetical protein EIN_430210 [Entamoeba invadens IP1]|uniref:Uncharacterized protein n=1 Tax=Entamoeba invadens IP1 TaxID=370355 RepID=A0A0A1UF58_ENTIV|nr:hypothetical protein EIN_430210 [Entamoeba invadens IP1]ELP95225.1 hypothetical protein EIN_430210 [Entamoeba invadens IP1]|eukprot:XP_004261996.1 hypothetical protein EIN_430210 [Entamoeba invadens IP1]